MSCGFAVLSECLPLAKLRACVAAQVLLGAAVVSVALAAGLVHWRLGQPAALPTTCGKWF